MTERIRKHLAGAVKAVDAEAGTMTIVISTESRDRDGDIVSLDGWNLDPYMQNPVVLFAHDYKQPPVGRALKVWADDKSRQLLAEMEFAPTPLGQQLRLLYAGGFMTAASVGFDPIKWEPEELDSEGLNESGEDLSRFWRPTRFTEQELWEFSLVPVPSNRDALRVASVAGMDDFIIKGLSAALGASKPGSEAIKGAISYASAHSGGTPKADDDADWNASAEVSAAEGREQLRRMHTWVDSEQDQELKGAYKLPHHKADGTLVWRGVSAAGGAVMGSRGGVSIPEGDVGGVKSHLARHYREFDRTPPWEAAESASPESLADQLDYVLSLIKQGATIDLVEWELARAVMDAIADLYGTWPDKKAHDGGDTPVDIDGNEGDPDPEVFDIDALMERVNDRLGS